ncbi:MAG TPA: M50 family metallopeptidase [Pirellulales bacterium]|nr:M50 family metallopeptidase [Pirellulales bacterium]
MLLNDPPPSAGDLHFSLLGIPVRVHPMFWVIGLVLGMTGGAEESLWPILVWVIAVFLSVLVHEMGHALVIRALGVQPWITLYGMGGLTNHQGGRFRPATQILVSFAGPAAGFLLAALIIVLVVSTGHDFRIRWGWPYLVVWLIGGFSKPGVEELCNDLLFVNIWWGILNLLPIFPLDGGRITNEVLNITYPRGALRVTLWISLVVATAMAATGLTSHPVQLFRVLLFGSLAYSNFQLLGLAAGGRRW